MPVSPSLSRWATLGPACSWASFAFVLHGIFQKAWLLAFGREAQRYRPEGEAQGPNDAPDSLSEQMGRRLAHVTKFLGDESRMAVCVTIGLLAKPIDDLTLSMLKLDGEGRLILDMLSKHGPLQVASRELVQLLVEGQVAFIATTLVLRACHAWCRMNRRVCCKGGTDMQGFCHRV